MSWLYGSGARIRYLEPLKDKTTFKIGGRARYFAEPAGEEELRFLICLARRHKERVLILGAGSNLLVDDSGVEALVIRLGSPYFKKIFFKGNSVEAGSGVMLGRFLKDTAARGLGGIGFLAGIPGTIGGALLMNAGEGRGARAIGDLIDRVRVMDYNGNIKILTQKKAGFGYRSSGLDKYVILSVSFRLKRSAKDRICADIREYLRQRRHSQDLCLPSAGCVFRNPRRSPAGMLIELAGFKGRSSGGAAVSARHANFIVNRRNATARDVLKLMREVKSAVKRKFQVELEPEVKIWRSRK